MTDVRTFALPDVGEGLTEAEILTWHVKPGDTVVVNQTIVEIETAKAAVELPCPYAGVVAEIFVSEGDVVPVGTPILTIAMAGTRPTEGTGPDAPATTTEGTGSDGPAAGIKPDRPKVEGTSPPTPPVTRERIAARVSRGAEPPQDPRGSARRPPAPDFRAHRRRGDGRTRA